MPAKGKPYRSWLQSKLADPQIAMNYLNAAMNDSPEMFLVALRNVAEAHRMAKVAEDAGLTREALYRTLSEGGNPRLSSLLGILNAIGLRLVLTSQAANLGSYYSSTADSPTYTAAFSDITSRATDVIITSSLAAADVTSGVVALAVTDRIAALDLAVVAFCTDVPRETPEIPKTSVIRERVISSEDLILDDAFQPA